MKLIVCSQINICSKNMFKVFTEEMGFEETGEKYDDYPVYQKGDFKLVNVKSDIITLEHLNSKFKPELYIVASSHTSQSGEKTLSVHSTGNWGSADLGGKPNELCLSAPFYQRSAFLNYMKNSLEGYSVCFETTHHGPSEMNAPLVFVEVGGSENEWNDMEAIRIACKVMLESSNEVVDEIKVAIGFGGPHYAPNYAKDYVLDKIAFSHICPKYLFDVTDEETIIQSFSKTIPKAEMAILDWKGLTKPQKDVLIPILEKHNIPWKRLSDLKK